MDKVTHAPCSLSLAHLIRFEKGKSFQKKKDNNKSFSSWVSILILLLQTEERRKNPEEIEIIFPQKSIHRERSF